MFFENDFYRKGYTIVPGALPPSVADAMLASVERLLNTEFNLSHISPSSELPWPGGNQNRVVEIVPTSDAPWWDDFLSLTPLHTALTTLTTRPCALKPNTPQTRHWYFPINYPESHPTSSTPSPNRRPILHTSASSISGRWQPINRRRYLGRGWHIDCGPGFPNPELRTTSGDGRQGPVILIVLSDCDVGEGGTCIVEGSHLAVYDYIDKIGEVSHEKLNEVFKARMRRRINEGKAFLIDDDDSENGDDVDGALKVTQVKAKKGDVILMHPLVVHSGTTNCSDGKVRVMGNGVGTIEDWIEGMVDPLLVKTKEHVGIEGGWRILMEEGGEDYLEKEMEEERQVKEIEKERVRKTREERRKKKDEKERRKNDKLKK